MTTTQRIQTARLSWIITAALLVIAAALFLTGCGKQIVDSAPDPLASSAAEEVAPPAPAVVENPLIKQFGEIVTYDDGVSVSAALIGPYTPGEYAQGIVEGQQPTVFKIVVTNNSDKPLDYPGSLATVSSGGQESSYISDVANPTYGDIGLFPTTTLQQGQTIEWYVGYSLADPTNVTLDVAPGVIEYDEATFTNIAP